MSSIDSVQQIVATIRAEMATRIDSSESRALGKQLRQTKKTKASSQDQRQQRMTDLISQRVRSLHPDDPKKGKKAFRIFLESVLLAEFGEALINDPAFYQMVDDIQHVMETDPRLADTIGKAVASLLDVQAGSAGAP